MRKLFLHIVSLFCITVVSSQPVFNKVFDVDNFFDGFKSVYELNDSLYLASGISMKLINGESNTILFCLNSKGDEIWRKEYNIYGRSLDAPNDIISKNDKLYIVGGYYDSITNFINSYLLNTNIMGDSIGTVFFSDTFYIANQKIISKSNKLFILRGVANQVPISNLAIEIVVLDTSLNITNVWSYSNNGFDDFEDFKVTNDNGFILAGYTDSYSSGILSDFYLMKIDSLGNIQWEFTYGTPNDEFTRNHNYLALTQDGGYVMCGEEDVGGLTNHQGVVLKVDSNGQMLWRKNVSEGEYTVCLSIREWQDGSLIVASNFTNYDSIIPFFNDPRGHLMKLSADGDSVIWERTFSKWNLDANNNPSGVSSDDYVHGMILTSDGGILVSGYQIHPKITNNDGWLIKFDSCGYSVGAQPQASFTIDSVIGNQVYISNLSEEYCIANMQISLIHSLQNDTSLLDSIHIYAYSPFTNGDDPTQLVYTIPDTGIYLFQLTTFAGDTFDIFTSSINVADTSTSIGGIQNNLVFNIFPNPTKNNIIVQLSASSPTASYGEIYAIDGRKVHDFTISANLLQTKIELPELQTGVYLVKINDDSGRSAMERITIL